MQTNILCYLPQRMHLIPAAGKSSPCGKVEQIHYILTLTTLLSFHSQVRCLGLNNAAITRNGLKGWSKLVNCVFNIERKGLVNWPIPDFSNPIHDEWTSGWFWWCTFKEICRPVFICRVWVTPILHEGCCSFILDVSCRFIGLNHSPVRYWCSACDSSLSTQEEYLLFSGQEAFVTSNCSLEHLSLRLTALQTKHWIHDVTLLLILWCFLRRGVVRFNDRYLTKTFAHWTDWHRIRVAEVFVLVAPSVS